MMWIFNNADSAFNYYKSQILNKGVDFDNLNRRLNEPDQNQLNSLIGIYKVGDHQKTLEYAKAMIDQFPSSVTLYNIVGLANRSLGHFDQAIEAFKKAAIIQPCYFEVFNNLGVTLQDKGDLQGSLQAFDKAI